MWEKDERELSSQPVGVVPAQERLARLEVALVQLMHSFGQILRLTLTNAAALKGERRAAVTVGQPEPAPQASERC
jgi:hypothetical protein